MPSDGTHDELVDADPVPVIKAKAIRLHVIYTALKEAGFSKSQSESFVAELVPEEFNGDSIQNF